jgi:hypothetical protein
LSNNQVSGTLSTEIGLVTEIERIMLEQNKLKGSIPTEIGLLDKLIFLSLAQNNGIDGLILTEMGNCRHLSEFVTLQCIFLLVLTYNLTVP